MRVCLTEGIADAFGKRIVSLSPDVEIVRLNNDGTLTPDTEGIEVFFFSEDIWLQPQALAARSRIINDPALKWFHSSSAGISGAIYQEPLDRGAILTHSPGLHAQPMAEYVFAYLLRHLKRMPEHDAAQARHEWIDITSGELLDKTIGIVGLGGIGLELARLAKAFRMRVLATKRTPIDAPNVDEILPPDRLQDLLHAADFVLITVPFTDETAGLIGAAEFAAMKPDALFLNVARGQVVDEPALIEALRHGRIAGAILDVVSQEPLSPDSPLWDLPNCIITPHNSSRTPYAGPRTTELFLQNLARYLRGEPLLHVVTTTGVAPSH